jgi:hypothetical protein
MAEEAKPPVCLRLLRVLITDVLNYEEKIAALLICTLKVSSSWVIC